MRMGDDNISDESFGLVFLKTIDEGVRSSFFLSFSFIHSTSFLIYLPAAKGAKNLFVVVSLF